MPEWWDALRCNLLTYRWFRKRCPVTHKYSGRKCVRAIGHLGHHGSYYHSWFPGYEREDQ